MLPTPPTKRGLEMWELSDAPGVTVTNATRQRRRPEPEASVGCHHTALHSLSSPWKANRERIAQEQQPMLIVSPLCHVGTKNCSVSVLLRNLWELNRYTRPLRELSACFTATSVPTLSLRFAALAVTRARVNISHVPCGHEWPCIPRAIRNELRYALRSQCVSRSTRSTHVTRAGVSQC